MTRSRSNCGPRADSSPDSPDVRRYVSVLSLVLAAAPAAAQLDSAALVRLERPRVVAAAERYLREAPVTITAFPPPRSAGGPHDFYSEGDYWWPDPRSPPKPHPPGAGQSHTANTFALPH